MDAFNSLAARWRVGKRGYARAKIQRVEPERVCTLGPCQRKPRVSVSWLLTPAGSYACFVQRRLADAFGADIGSSSNKLRNAAGNTKAASVGLLMCIQWISRCIRVEAHRIDGLKQQEGPAFKTSKRGSNSSRFWGVRLAPAGNTNSLLARKDRRRKMASVVRKAAPDGLREAPTARGTRQLAHPACFACANSSARFDCMQGW